MNTQVAANSMGASPSPTAGAKRAAENINMAFTKPGAQWPSDMLAQAIDREAGIPDLIEALSGWTDYAVNRDIPFTLIAKTRQALAKALNA